MASISETVSSTKTSDSPQIAEQPISDNDWFSGELFNDMNVKQLLTKRAQTNRPMQNFSLANAQLESINLVNRSSKSGYQLMAISTVPISIMPTALNWI